MYDSSSIQQILLQRRKSLRENAELETYVKGIIEEVKAKGDAALVKFTKKFDKSSLNSRDLTVSREEISEAYMKVTENQIRALKSAKQRLENVEKRLLERVNADIKLGEIRIKFCTRPLERVGCYVPGGKATYPSTVIMTVVPARFAGVSNIVVCSPPSENGSLNPLTVVAADICGANKIYKVGGAQAIAAMAYGTQTIKPVDKIVGPGNIYVTLAKMLVSKDVPIDFPAGPSELLVLADETADPRYIALDMCAQAEHGFDSVVGLATTSRKLAERIISQLWKTAKSTPRSAIVVEAIFKSGFAVVCRTIDEMVEFANAFAPEHVEIMLKNPEDVADRISTAGIILIGPYSPASLSDYYGGTNHVLPTSGFSKIFSGLSALDFVRRVAIVECSKTGLLEASEVIKIFSEAEKLPGHFKAVKWRLKNESSSRRADQAGKS
jgi:histidinol dehydrogenase